MIVTQGGQKKLVPDAEMMRILLGVIDRLDRFYGVSKAEKAKIKASDALAKLIGASPEEIPE